MYHFFFLPTMVNGPSIPDAQNPHKFHKKTPKKFSEQTQSHWTGRRIPGQFHRICQVSAKECYVQQSEGGWTKTLLEKH